MEIRLEDTGEFYESLNGKDLGVCKNNGGGMVVVGLYKSELPLKVMCPFCHNLLQAKEICSCKTK